MVLSAQGVSKRYLRKAEGSNHFFAVQKTDFTLQPGRLVMLTGRSGSGKTTLLHMLSGLLAPTEGKVLLDGQDLYALADQALSRLRNAHIAVIPQGKAAVASLSVLENICLPRLLYGAEDARTEAMALMERLEIGHLADAAPSELSGGELRRMSIARALGQHAEVLLADEPTGDLDDESTHRVLGMLKEKAQSGAAVLLVTHEMEAARYADEVWRMDSGKLFREDGV